MATPNRFVRRWFTADRRTDRPIAGPSGSRRRQAERERTSGYCAPMVMEMGYRRIAVAIDRPLARYLSHEVRRECQPMPGKTVRAARRASVEIFCGVSGNPQYALLGGLLVPSTVDELEVQLNISENRPTGAATTCPGTFGRDLIPGLADQFVKGIPGHSCRRSLARASSRSTALPMTRSGRRCMRSRSRRTFWESP